MTVIVALDKFKGSLTTFQANEVVKNAIKEVFPAAKVFCFPMADGGDGFADVMQHYLQTKTISVATVNALQMPIISNYQWDEKNSIALIEVAKASGMQQLAKHQLNPLFTSTYGTGVLINHAIQSGAKKIILGLGGSATNDGGIGILDALGFKFLDSLGNVLVPMGKHLSQIAAIKEPINGIPNIRFELACDVDNTLFGANGAAYMYAAQKGASPADILHLDKGLQHLTKITRLQCGTDYSQIKGCGAAGGIPVGILSFFNAKIVKGINVVLNHSNLLSFATQADIIITGEGKVDDQSLHGKVVHSIADIAKLYKKCCIAYCGINSSGNSLAAELKNIYQIKKDDISMQYAIDNADALLFNLVKSTIEQYA
jgi:glycerate kinase